MVTERKLTKAEKDELDAAREGFELEEDGLTDVLDALGMGVDDEMLFRLGVWVGDQVATLTGWVWVHLEFGPALEAPGLVAADRSVCFLPLQAVASAVEAQPDPWSPAPRPLVVMLSRLRAGDRPQGEPDSYALVTP